MNYSHVRKFAASAVLMTFIFGNGYSQSDNSYIFWSDVSNDRVEIIKSEWTSEESTLIANSINRLDAIVYKSDESGVFVSEKQQIYRTNRNFLGFELIVSDDKLNITDRIPFFDIDEQNQMLYYVRSYIVFEGGDITQKSEIVMHDFEAGTSDIIIEAISGEFTQEITSVRVSGSAQKLYWTHRIGSDQYLKRSDLDGSGEETLLDRTTDYTHMFIDDENENVYYISNDETHKEKLYRADLDGSENVIVANIDMMVNDITISTADEFIFFTSSSNIHGIFLGLGETNAALLDMSDPAYKPETVRGVHGIFYDGQSGSLVWQDNYGVIKEKNADGILTHLTIPGDIGLENTLTFDKENNRLIYTNGLNGLYAISPDPEEPLMVFDKSTPVSPTIFGYTQARLDTTTGTMYWEDGGWNINPGFDGDREISIPGIKTGAGFDIDIENERIYYYKKNEGIFRVNLDGTDEQLITGEGSFSTAGLAYHPDLEKIYYGDIERIYSINTDGSDREIFATNINGLIKELTYDSNLNALIFLETRGAQMDSIRYWKIDQSSFGNLKGSPRMKSFAMLTYPGMEFATPISDEALFRPSEIILSQNYPNPFNPSTRIAYSVSGYAHVRLEVYNALGQLVAILVNGEKRAGWHEVAFDASNLSSGLYLYRLQTEGQTESRQMLLIR